MTSQIKKNETSKLFRKNILNLFLFLKRLYKSVPHLWLSILAESLYCNANFYKRKYNSYADLFNSFYLISNFYLLPYTAQHGEETAYGHICHAIHYRQDLRLKPTLNDIAD